VNLLLVYFSLIARHKDYSHEASYLYLDDDVYLGHPYHGDGDACHLYYDDDDGDDVCLCHPYHGSGDACHLYYDDYNDDVCPCHLCGCHIDSCYLYNDRLQLF